MIIDPKLVELTSDVLKIFLYKTNTPTIIVEKTIYITQQHMPNEVKSPSRLIVVTWNAHVTSIAVFVGRISVLELATSESDIGPLKPWS